MEIVAGEPLGRGFRGGVNRQRVLGFRLGSEFVRVGDRVRKGGPFVWGAVFGQTCVNPPLPERTIWGRGMFLLRTKEFARVHENSFGCVFVSVPIYFPYLPVSSPFQHVKIRLNGVIAV